MGLEYASFVAIHVTDMEQSRRFWTEALGFEPISHLLVEGRSPSAVELGLDTLRTEGLFLGRDGIRVQLQHQDRPDHVALPDVRQQLGLSHFGMRVSDMDATLALVEQHGGHVIEGCRHTNEQYQSEVARITDPNGVRIELLEMPTPLDQLPGNPVA